MHVFYGGDETPLKRYKGMCKWKILIKIIKLLLFMSASWYLTAVGVC